MALTNFAVPVNNYLTTATSARSIGGSSLVVSSVTGLPSLTGSQYFRLSIFSGSTPTTILKATGLNVGTKTFTIAGPVDGYADVQVNGGDQVSICDAAGSFSDIHTAVNLIEGRDLNLAQYIAAAGGSADTGMANAIAALGTAGGRIYVPPGTYTFASPIVLDTKNGIVIEGTTDAIQGQLNLGSIFVYSGTASGFFTTRSCHGVSVKGVTFRYSSSSFQGDLIKADKQQGTTTYSVSVTVGSPVVTGSGTAWDSTIVNQRLIFSTDSSSVQYSVLSVQSTTQLTLKTNVASPTVSGANTATNLDLPIKSDTGYLKFNHCAFGASSGTTDNARSLVSIDGSHDTEFDGCEFWGGTWGLIGKSNAGITNNSGYAINCTVRRCFFQQQKTASIRNVDQSWIVANCSFEPLSNGLPGAWAQDTTLTLSPLVNFTAQGVTFSNNWLGDAGDNVLGSWLMPGQSSGLNITGNWFGVGQKTTAIQLTVGSVNGLVITGNRFSGNPGNFSTAIDLGNVTSCSGYVILGNRYSSIDRPLRGFIPTDTVYDLGGTNLATPALTAAQATFTPAASVNLLSKTQADFESGGVGSTVGWGSNNNALLSASSAQSKTGTYSCLVQAQAVAQTVSIITGFGKAMTATPSVYYTAFAWIKSPTTPRHCYVQIVTFSSDGTTQNVFTGPMAMSSSSTWTQFSVNAQVGFLAYAIGVSVVIGDATDGSLVQTNELHYVDSCSLMLTDNTNPAYGLVWNDPGSLPAVSIANGAFTGGDASALTVLSTGSTTARTLAARFANGVYNVQDFGATGLGVVDDQPAIMAALRYLSNLSTSTGFRRTLYFPAGTYLIGSATNSQGIMCGRQYLPKADNSLWPITTLFHAITLLGDGYNTSLVSNCPTGISEILRMEDCPVSKVEGFRLLVQQGMPVTKAAYHVCATSSAENHHAEDISVEVNRFLFSINVTNGNTAVTAAGSTTWSTTNLIGKYLLVAGDTTSTAYLIDATPTSTSMTLHTAYLGTTGQTTARIQGDGVPVGIGVGLDYPNDSAQFRFMGCKVSNASYAGIMVGAGVVGNVLDIRFYGCQSLHCPVGIFGWSAPFLFEGGALTFNSFCDIYALVAGGPMYVTNVRSEGSNQLYVNNGGGTSLSPVTLSNITFTSWGGITYGGSLQSKMPFVTANVSVTNGSADVTGINTVWHSPGQFVVGQKLIFDNDTTQTLYTIASIDPVLQTKLTLTVPYAGPTNANTWVAPAGPKFTMSTLLGLDGTVGPVTATNGSPVVTGPANWTTGLVANFHSLVFDSDIDQMPYSILSVDSGTQVTLNSSAKGTGNYQGPTGLTRVKCGQVEGFAFVGRAGGLINLFGVICSRGPQPYGYARWNFSAGNCWVNSIGCSTSTAGATSDQARDQNFFGGGTNLAQANFCVLPGPAMISDGTQLFRNPLGFWCNYQANFNQRVGVGQFLTNPLYTYHQQGGSMRVQKIPDPGATPSVTVHGTPGATTYYYKYIFRDLAGFQTVPGPSSSVVNNSQPYTSFSNVFASGNYNSVAIAVTYNTSNPAYIDILRSTDNATWYSVVTSNVSGATLLPDGVTYSWNPYTTNAMNSTTLTYNDYSTTAPLGPVTLPTRNGTADATFDGRVSMNGQAAPYPGTGGGEINGAQTTDATFTAKNQSMLQTVYDLARAFGLLA